MAMAEMITPYIVMADRPRSSSHVSYSWMDIHAFAWQRSTSEYWSDKCQVLATCIHAHAAYITIHMCHKLNFGERHSQRPSCEGRDTIFLFALSLARGFFIFAPLCGPSCLQGGWYVTHICRCGTHGMVSAHSLSLSLNC